MKIICIGFPRTGTYSLAHALKHLGYTVLDHIDVYENFLPEFYAILRGQETEEMMERVCNAADVLTGQFVSNTWYKLYLQHPDVKVIFRESNDLEKWSRGVSKFLSDALKSHKSAIPLCLRPTAHHRDKFVKRMIVGLNPELYTTRDKPESFLRAHSLHKAQVVGLIPSDQLLVFRPADGWAPICRFLNIQKVPEIPYPHFNASSSKPGTKIEFISRLHQTNLYEKIRREHRRAVLLILTVFVIIFAVCVTQIKF